jgi:hypothetical protein
MKMAQVAKAQSILNFLGSLNPHTVRVSTENLKDEVILVRCASFRPATAVFRFNNPVNAR